jgi:hypothetical protein
MEKLIYRREKDDYNPQINIKKLQENSHRHLPELESLVSPKQRRRIIKKVFHNNEIDFQIFFRKLSSLASWREAFQLVEEELHRRRISSSSAGGTLLINIVYRHYFPHDQEVKIE